MKKRPRARANARPRRRAAARATKQRLAKAIAAQEFERRRIALDLHDHLGQRLTALRLVVGAMKSDVRNSKHLQSRLDAVEDILIQMDRDVDVLVSQLRPIDLGARSLRDGLSTLLGHWSATYDIRVDFRAAQADQLPLSPEVESHVYRIAQEALTNIGKHAAAHHVSVLLERRNSDVILIIEDDGRGFDPERARADKVHRIGLAGMRERAALIGGTLEVESSVGKGTTVFVRVPVGPRP